MRNLKKGLVSLLAVAILVVSIAGSAFAASSPTWGKKQTASNGTYWYKISSNYAVKKAAASKAVKADTVRATITAKGKTYKVTRIGANAYKGCSKLKTIRIKSATATQVMKTAFKGLKKSQVRNIKVYVTKTMKVSNFAKLYKALLAAGISYKNIKISKAY